MIFFGKNAKPLVSFHSKERRFVTILLGGQTGELKDTSMHINA
jgi:hypothetical protein